MKFDKMSTSEFNSIFETTLEKSMTWDEVIKDFDKNELDDYFYVSMAKEDVMEAIENKDKELIEQLNLWLIYIEQVGVYIAIKQ